MRISKPKIMRVAMLLAVLTAMIPATQTFAVSANAAEQNEPVYIKEIRLAEKSAEYNDTDNPLTADGYTVIKDADGNDLDVNQNADSDSTPAKDHAEVYIGYKTTTDRSEAITDIAVMNMKGGYDVHAYDLLMESDFKKNIIPFADRFLDAVKEYRTNYNSSNEANKKRADFVREVLNKYTDDDCDEARLGELLLYDTKYEMGDDAYNKLPVEEQETHADILTIISQANGQSLLTIENALIRAADTNNNTWIDRLLQTTYDDLVDKTGLSPAEAQKELDKLYSDDAEIMADMLGEFIEYLGGYDNAKNTVGSYSKDAVGAAVEAYEDMTGEEDADTKASIEKAYYDAAEQMKDVVASTELLIIYNLLSEAKYGDKTLLEFFMDAEKTAKDDKTVLYPVVASLTAGQRAGLEFVSLKDLISIAAADPENIKMSYTDEMKTVSVYAGVDRDIFQEGGVGVTSDTIRSQAAELPVEDPASTYNSMYYCVASSGICLIDTALMLGTTATILTNYANALNSMGTALSASFPDSSFRASAVSKRLAYADPLICVIGDETFMGSWIDEAKKMYHVEYNAIPRYMVAEKDIIGYNAKGEKIVLKNQPAYYKAATVNNRKDQEPTSPAIGDLNGSTGKQWLALYYAKNEGEQPILADSLQAVLNSSEIPEGYTAGIHAFKTTAAENLNNTLYVRNDKAPEIYIYYKTEDADAAGAKGSSLTMGYFAIAAAVGLLIGVGVAVICITASRKKKKESVEAEKTESE